MDGRLELDEGGIQDFNELLKVRPQIYSWGIDARRQVANVELAIDFRCLGQCHCLNVLKQRGRVTTLHLQSFAALGWTIKSVLPLSAVRKDRVTLFLASISTGSSYGACAISWSPFGGGPCVCCAIVIVTVSAIDPFLSACSSNATATGLSISIWIGSWIWTPAYHCGCCATRITLPLTSVCLDSANGGGAMNDADPYVHCGGLRDLSYASIYPT